jgi:phenylacetic acid degradation operon negative regulatory protein
MLTTMLGDYWFWRREHLPSAVLVRLLKEFGTSTASARASIRRLTDRGVLVRSRNGRTTSYGLRFRTQEALVEHAHKLLSWGASSPSWDGLWTVVAFSIPEGSRNLRHSVRVGLGRLGLRLLYDGVWVTPFDRSHEAVDLLRALDVTTATVTRATEVVGSPQGGTPLQAFDLTEVSDAYDAFAAQYEPVADRVRRGEFEPAEAFLARESLMSDWMVLRQLDPDLPSELLPETWPRPQARRLFVQIYDSLGPLGEQRFREIVSEIDPELGRLATHHTSTNMVPIPDLAALIESGRKSGGS